MTKDRIQQFTLRIAQANSTDLVVILYEMLLDYIEEGKVASSLGDNAAVTEAVRKARNVLNELLESLDMRYEPAANLRKLYFYCLRKLVHAQSGKEGALDEICKVIIPLRDAYAQIAPSNENGPVMGNSQTVYAGLTYGRNELTENMTDQGSNRGMRV